MRICKEEGCNKPVDCRGLCHTHYQRLRRAGKIKIQGFRSHGTLEERFWRRVKKTEGCWWWTGSKRSNGYGQLQEGGKGSRSLSTHRISYELHKGEIPEGMFVMHSCDNPACVNPEHLSLGTPKENAQDMFTKGRNGYGGLKGEAHFRAKLTELQVLKIRDLYDARQKRIFELAKEYGVAQRTIRSIVLRQNWTHI